MWSRLVPCVLLALTACAEPGVSAGSPPPTELLVTVPADRADVPVTGWDGWAVDPPLIREWVWVPRERGVDAGWAPQDHAVPWDPGVGTAIATDGTRAPLVDEAFAGSTLLVGQHGVVPPGHYDLLVRAEGLSVQRPGLRVDEHGQSPDFDPASLGDRVFPLDIRHTSLGTITGLLPQLYLRARELRPGVAQVDVWAEGTEAPLCRAWQGEADLSPTGVLSIFQDEITTSGRQEITFTDVSLHMGFLPDAQEVAGIELGATVDASQLDPVFAAQGEVVEGAACAFLARVGQPCRPCADSSASTCVGFETRAGWGPASTEAAVRRAAGALELEHIDEAPPCGGPADSSLALTCSTVGSVGIGAWFLGLGALLLRRRRAGSEDLS